MLWQISRKHTENLYSSELLHFIHNYKLLYSAWVEPDFLLNRAKYRNVHTAFGDNKNRGIGVSCPPSVEPRPQEET